jgi:hypothetical protein
LLNQMLNFWFPSWLNRSEIERMMMEEKVQQGLESISGQIQRLERGEGGGGAENSLTSSDSRAFLDKSSDLRRANLRSPFPSEMIFSW